jgi:hypothetical protein
MKDQVYAFEEFETNLSKVYQKAHRIEAAKRNFPDSPLPSDLSTDFKTEVQTLASDLTKIRGNRGVIHNALRDIPSTFQSPHFWESIRQIAGDEKTLRMASNKNHIDRFLEKAITEAEEVTSKEYRAYMKAKDEFVNDFVSLAPAKAPSRKPQLPQSTPR